MSLVCTSMYQVKSINKAIKIAKKGSHLHGLPPVSDLNDEVVEVPGAHPVHGLEYCY